MPLARSPGVLYTAPVLHLFPPAGGSGPAVTGRVLR